MDPPGTVPLFLSLTSGRSHAMRKRAGLAGRDRRVLRHHRVRVVRPVDPRLPRHHAVVDAGRRRSAAAARRPRTADRQGRRAERDRATSTSRWCRSAPRCSPVPARSSRPSCSSRAVDDVGSAVALALGIVAVHVVLWLFLRFSVVIMRVIKDSGVTFVTRIAGLLLSAIAVQLVANVGDGDRQAGMTAGQPEQLGAAGLPTRLFSCTPTRLTTWLDCPRRYRFTYLDRPSPPKGPPWAHNSLGSSVHLALAGCWRLDARDRSIAAAGRLLEHVWLRDGFRDDEQVDELARRGPARWSSGMPSGSTPPTSRWASSAPWRRAPEVLAAVRSDRPSRRPRRAGRRCARGRRLQDGTAELTVLDARGSLALALYALAAGRTFRRDCVRGRAAPRAQWRGRRARAHRRVTAATPRPCRVDRR